MNLLGNKKYPAGFTPVPITVFMANSDENDVDERSCPIVGSGNTQMKKTVDKMFEKHQDVINFLKKPILKAF